MNKNPLDLDQLTMDDIDFEGLLPKITEEFNKVEKECREKYDENWFEHYTKKIRPNDSIDITEKWINDAIYSGYALNVTGSPESVIETYDRYNKKLKQFFGRSYKHYIHHKPNNPKINKLLIEDAIKTGKWKELPEQLHEEYHKQVMRTIK